MAKGVLEVSPPSDDIDVFLLYNEREEIPGVVEELRKRHLSVFFFQTDFPYGGDIVEGEAKRLQNARAVLVLLGDHGWGPTQRQIAAKALSLEKMIIPALIGNAPETALDDVDGLFRKRRWADLRSPSSSAYEKLAQALHQGAISDGTEREDREHLRFDEIINTLVDGSDADRSALLERIIRQDIPASHKLVARIQKSIREDFSPSREGQFGKALRDPKRLASTRSWFLSVLIWLEALSNESRKLILDHLDPKFEQDRNVRFWTLAGIVERRLPYLSDAIRRAIDDPAPEVADLAEVAARPDDRTLLIKFKSALASSSFEIAWHVLRILRVVSIPALAGDVIAQLDRVADGSSLTYDALFALANPQMALAAMPIILEQRGLQRFAQLVVREARASTPIARTAFARALCVFDPQQVRVALQDAAENEEDRQLIRRLLGNITEVLNAESETSPPIAGFASDTIDISKDDIGIAKDVETLASVILAREVVPPLAIGLFGEWGSGKSFFMQSIEAAADRIARHAKAQKRDQFCSDIVQIKFNAWHYADTSLWASLVSHLLDGLSHHLVPEPTMTEQQATLAGELASTKAEMASAEAERARASARLEDSARSLQDKILERERREIRLRDLRAQDLLALLEGNDQLDKELKEALTAVGAPAALESISELNKVVEESYSTAGRAVALLVSIFSGKNITIVVIGIALLFLAPPLISWAIQELVNARAANLSALTTQVTVIAGSVALVLGKALKHAKSGLDALSLAKRKVDKRLAEKRATPTEDELELEKRVAEAKAVEAAAAERVAVATARAQEIESRVAALKESRSLGYFISERTRSDDYRRHLGLISLIRKDFDGMVERLRASTAEEGKKVDRIILYIDDVDRCPPHMVVDILQAIHLLLAYELFVVVVSVDPRWLLRSLESHFTHLQADRPSSSEPWNATPQDYLEKIFQVPFSVRPMDDKGYGRLMRRLLAPSAPSPTPNSRQPHASNQAQRVVLPPSSAEVTAEIVPNVSDPAPTEAPAPLELDELADSLSIGQAEAAFAETLHMLLPTPRSAKRFANTYRLLKASLPRGDLSRYEGTSSVPGTFQLPMVLLAMLVGDSKTAATLFTQFISNANRGLPHWWQANESSASADGSPDVQRLRAQVAEIVQAPLFPQSPELLLQWLPRVARYSFSTARMFLDER